jgi:two-component system sensor histidine kinase PilS (NtrC family)
MKMLGIAVLNMREKLDTMVDNDSDVSVRKQPDATGERTGRNWSALRYLNLYRSVVAVALYSTNFLGAHLRPFGQIDPQYFLFSSIAYVGFSVMAVFAAAWRWPRFKIQIHSQLVIEIVLIAVMIATSGGVQSGLAWLMMVSLVFNVLVMRARMVMFYAALATASVLITQVFDIWFGAETMSSFGQAGMFGMAFFMISGGAYVLVERARRSEALAVLRSVDVQNLAQINQLVIDDMQDGVIVLDSEGRIRQSNRHAHNLLADCDKAEDRTLAQYFPALGQYLEQWRLNHEIQFPTVILGERNEHFQPRFIAVGQARIFGAVLLLKDMSRVYEEARQIKLAALGQLTANIAHEIRNPLAAISHAAELLSEDAFQGQGRLLQIVLNNSQRINHLIQDVMVLNRRDRIKLERIELFQFMHDFINDFVMVSRIQSHCITWECPPEAVLCFDLEHLRQVLTNLCANAVKYGQGISGSVRIWVADMRDGVAIHCADDGKGVSAEHLPRLFEPFFTTDTAAGTGLGLYISRELCLANGASLEYVSGSAGGNFRILSLERACRGQQ